MALDCFRAESCSPFGERMAVPHHFIPLLLGCLSASLKMERDTRRHRQSGSDGHEKQPTDPASAGRNPRDLGDGTLVLFSRNDFII